MIDCSLFKQECVHQTKTLESRDRFTAVHTELYGTRFRGGGEQEELAKAPMPRCQSVFCPQGKTLVSWLRQECLNPEKHSTARKPWSLGTGNPKFPSPGPLSSLPLTYVQLLRSRAAVVFIKLNLNLKQ
jgi:hypothetical protein